MEQKAELQHENRDSITVKRNAKGEYAWDLKAYYDIASDAAQNCKKTKHIISARIAILQEQMRRRRS